MHDGGQATALSYGYEYIFHTPLAPPLTLLNKCIIYAHTITKVS